jgi:glyceraldehyde 3-phosphate dehydrogenase/glyceraldehyde-3-phosphate dehydrogenase (NAD(P))
MKRVAINGMGRTGRVMLRQWLSGYRDDVEVVAVNDILPADNLAYLLRYDSVHGRLPWQVQGSAGRLQIGEHEIRCLQNEDPATLPWGEMGIDVVIECTGLFTERELAARHLSAGAQRVLIGAPSSDADFVLVMGINESDFDPDSHHVVSNASCTTNSLVPALKVLNERFGLEAVNATTIHAVTASQSVVDRPAKKMHRGRAAGVSMIPTSSGADKAAVQVMPELAGHISVSAVRVPVPDGSLTDITALLSQDATAADVNGALRAAAESSLNGILGYSEDELVSVDILGETCSGLIHAAATRATGRMIKVYVWYDNETGYACRCLDVAGGVF